MLAALGLLIWNQELRVSGANKGNPAGAEKAPAALKNKPSTHLANANALRDTPATERNAQTTLRAQQDGCAPRPTKRELTIEELQT
ncbi:hypothetical protein [Pseudomonas sp. S11A4]|uniref:hypothetical protein n=1 Tax=Pseudomonas sp. S11A4 TaxID=1476791 RepID=UPI00406BFB95